MRFLKLLLLTFVIIIKPVHTQDSFTWEHLNGPMAGIVGGLGITANGDIYAGLYTGWLLPYSGLFKSTDNGESWRRLDFDITGSDKENMVYSIYVTKNDDIFVGCNYGDRIARSTDGGNTWISLFGSYPGRECWAIIEDHDGNLYAGDGQYYGVYKSTDYGATWDTSVYIRPLCFAVDTNNILYSGTHDGLFATSDGGENWGMSNVLAGIEVPDILIDSSNNDIYAATGYYGDGWGILKSTDAGATWQSIGPDSIVVFDLEFDLEGNLLASTRDEGLFISPDRGVTWFNSRGLLLDHSMLRMRLNKDGDIFIGSESDGVLRSTDGGENFEIVGVPAGYVRDITVYEDTLIFTSSSNGLHTYSRNSGAWQFKGLSDVWDIDFTYDNKIIAATADDGLFISDDLGQSWNEFGFNDTTFWIHNVCVADSNTIYFTADVKGLVRTTDNGVSWEELNINNSYFNSEIQVNGDYVYSVGSNGTILRISLLTDKIDTIFTFTFPVNRMNNSFEFVGDSIVFVTNTFSDLDTSLYRSMDGGENWEPLLDSLIIHSIKYDTLRKTLFVATAYGLYYSKDLGNTWQIEDPGLFYKMMILDMEFLDDGTILAGTGKHGLYKINAVLGLDDETEKPGTHSLNQNYPNPFNPSTTISYTLSRSSDVELIIYDITGRKIKELINEVQPAGEYKITFDGSGLASGVYFYKLKTDQFTKTKKMILMK